MRMRLSGKLAVQRRQALSSVLILSSALYCGSAFAEDASSEANFVRPERATAVLVSNHDLNRVHCSAAIDDVLWSKEKPVAVKQEGNDVWVKFLTLRQGTNETRASAPLDLHVTCAGEVYTLILHPREMDTVTVQLGDPTRQRISASVKAWGALALEEKVKRLTLAVYRNDIPTSFGRRRIEAGDPRRSIALFDNADVIGQQEVVANGLGLKATEYVVLAHEAVELSETDFISPAFGDIVAITVEPKKLPADGFARLIVIERSVDRGRL